MRSAVVVGAGVGGLAVAGALARTGWQVTLLERAERLRSDGAGQHLWPNGFRALRALDLGGGLDAIVTAVPHTGVRRPDGQLLTQPDPAAARSAPAVVHSEDLHDTLMSGLGEHMTIVNGVSVRTARIAPDDPPSVSDGRTSWEADLVVAADGAQSVLRQRLVRGASLVSAGCVVWRAVIPWYRAPVLPPGQAAGGDTIGDGYRFQYALLGERGSAGASSRGGVYWVATALGAPRPEPPATQLTLLRRWFARWHAPIGDLLAATEPGDLVQSAVRELRPGPRSYAVPSGPGGFVLLGDAAHALPDHLGQGTSVAFEDAATLRTAVREAIPGRSLRDALDAYSRARVPRLERLARLARKAGTLMQARSGLTHRAWDAAFGTSSPRVLDKVAGEAAAWWPGH